MVCVLFIAGGVIRESRWSTWPVILAEISWSIVVSEAGDQNVTSDVSLTVSHERPDAYSAGLDSKCFAIVARRLHNRLRNNRKIIRSKNNNDRRFAVKELRPRLCRGNSIILEYFAGTFFRFLAYFQSQLCLNFICSDLQSTVILLHRAWPFHRSLEAAKPILCLLLQSCLSFLPLYGFAKYLYTWFTIIILGI